MFYHDHEHLHIHRKTQKALWGAIAFNLVFVVIEVFFGWKANSVALFSDAGHNLSDAAGLLVAALALWAAKAKPNKNYTYGFQSLTIVAALINSVLLIGVVAEIFKEAAERLLHPQETDGGIVMWVALGSIAAKGLSAWVLHRGCKHDLSVKGAYVHMLADTMSGVSVLIAGAVIAFTGWEWIDPILGILIGLMIVRSSWKVWHGALRLSLHGVPLHINPEKIAEFLKSQPRVIRIHDLHIWALSAQLTALSVNLVYEATPGNEALRKISKELSQYGIDHTTLQVELAENIQESCELEPQPCYKKEDCPECRE